MLNIVTYDDAILKQRSEEVKIIDKEIKKLVKEMFKTMYQMNGIGLAAVQVGILKRIFVVDVPKEGKFAMINPVLKDFSREKSIVDEGCLSLPGINAEVERPGKITIAYTDINGKQNEIKADGLLATCIQHEYDHLNGILFIDKISPDIRLEKIKEYRKLKVV